MKTWGFHTLPAEWSLCLFFQKLTSLTLVPSFFFHDITLGGEKLPFALKLTEFLPYNLHPSLLPSSISFRVTPPHSLKIWFLGLKIWFLGLLQIPGTSVSHTLAWWMLNPLI